MPIIKPYRTQVDVQAWTPQGAYYHRDLMGDLKTIQTSKTTTQPYGTFTLTFTMREDAGGSWADKLPFRTYVEMCAGVGRGTPPILMRGLLDEPGQTLTMPAAPTGPQREVTVSGRDLGAILTDWQILYLWGIDPMALYLEANMQAGDALQAQLGVSAGEQRATVLLNAFITKLVNGHAVQGLQTALPVPAFTPQIAIPEAYRVNFLSLQPWQGSYSNFLDYFASPPWGEDFVFDAPEGPQIIVRQTPYKNYVTGQYPLPYGGTPTENGFFPDITIAAGDVADHDLAINSGDQVYTYYSTTPDLASSLAQSYAQFFYVSPGTQIQTTSVSKGQIQTQTQTFATRTASPTTATSATPTVQTSVAQARTPGSNPYYDVAKANIWGIRPLQLTTPWVSTLQQVFGTDAQAQVAALNTWLVNVFADNDKFVSGTLRVHGHEKYTVGRYAVMEPGAVASYPRRWEAYLQQVDHTIDIASNGATWTTDLGVIRGRVRA